MSTSTKWLFYGSFLASTLIAYLGAFSLSSFTERQLVLNEDEKPSTISEVETKPSKKAKPRKRSQNPSRYVKTIVQRSIFDSSKANQVQETEEADGDIVATDLNLTLLATIITKTDVVVGYRS